MEDEIMDTQHDRTFGQNFPNGLQERAVHQNQTFPRGSQSLGHQNKSTLEHQFRNSLSDCTSSCNSSIFSSNRSRSSYFLSMSSLQSSLGSSSQSSLFMPNISHQTSPPSPRKIISRERPAVGPFFCPICIQFKDAQPIVYMKRKGEMKSHIQNHLSDSLWHCDNCPTARDRFEDLKAHCKRVHGRPLRSTAHVCKIEHLIPQELFACGFRDWTRRKDCKQAFTNSKDWLDHIAKHMEGGSIPAEWSYSAVIKTLLRQPELSQFWKDYLYMCEGRDKRDWTPLVWDIDRSRTLMLKLSRRDFRPAISNLLAWAYELGLPTDQPMCRPADHSTNTLQMIPTLKPPLRVDLHGLSMTEIETVLNRHSSLAQNIQALPVSHDSTTMAQVAPVLEFITDHSLDIPPTQIQPESHSDSWSNLQLASGIQGPSEHDSSIFALPENTLPQCQPQSFHQDPNLPLDADQSPGEANGPTGSNSHFLGRDTHTHTSFDCSMFDTPADCHINRPII